MRTAFVAWAFCCFGSMAMAATVFVSHPPAKDTQDSISATTRPTAKSTVASASALASATTRPAAQPSAAQSSHVNAPEKFPTPAELIAKLHAERRVQASLPHVAYFDLSGPIVEKPADFSLFGEGEATTLRSVLDRMRQAKADKDLRAVLITLGGEHEMSLAQAQEVRDTLADITRSGKQTFVYADSYDTASYIAASGANHICMLEGGEIMMPGVGMEAMFAKGLLDKLGVKADYIQIGEYKGADEEYTRTGPSEQLKGEMNKLADALYKEIIDGISLSRNLSSDDVRAIIDDAMLSGQAAKDRGLVDHLVDEDGLRDLIASELGGGGKKINLIHDYGQPPRQEPDFSNPFSFLMSMAKKPESSNKPHVALIYVDGVIADGASGQSMMEGSVCGSDDLRRALREAARDDGVKAVVLRINSPGGSALASEVIWQAARRVESKKPLIVSIGSMAASGGYYISSSADRIFADPCAIVGSIGVVGGKFVWKDLYAKLGVGTESFTKGRNADLFSSSTPFTESQRRMITNWMKQTYDQFTQRVTSTRGSKIKDIDAVARGRIFSAKQGKEIGLVDEIGGLQSALAYAAHRANLKGDAYDVEVLPQPRTLADYFMGGGNDAKSPIRPNVAFGVSSLFQLLPDADQHVLAEQLATLQLFQKHPVLLVSPFTISVH